jgi:hypothetical protein
MNCSLVSWDEEVDLPVRCLDPALAVKPRVSSKGYDGFAIALVKFH